MVLPRAFVVALVSLLAGCRSKRLKTADVAKLAISPLEPEESFGLPELGDLVADAEEAEEEVEEKENTEEDEAESTLIAELGQGGAEEAGNHTDLAELGSTSMDSLYGARR